MVLREAERGAHEGLGGGGAQADDHFGMDDFDFGFEPGAAGFDLTRGRLGVDAALAALFESEMFDGVGASSRGMWAS